MNCQRACQLLSDYEDGRLDAREAGEVAAHLRDCGACGRLRDALATFESKVRETAAWQSASRRDLPRRALEGWLAEREMNAPHRRHSFRPAFHLAAMRPARWGTAAMALLLALLGLMLARWDREPSQRPRPIPTVRLPHPLRSVPAPNRGPLAAAEGTSSRDEKKPALVPRPGGPRVPHSGPFVASHSTSGDRGHRFPGTALGSLAHTGGDLARINDGPGTAVRRWLPPPRDEWDRVEERVRQETPVRDDFVTVPFPRVVSVSDAQIAAAVAGYRQEAAVVDTRLSREVTLAVKATALVDLCAQLQRDTGIRLEAGRSVADEKVTVFCEKMPLRDVMRQLGRPFGYTWLRSTLNTQHSTLNTSEPSTEHRAPSTEYRYELVQDLRSQLSEEELRNRDRNAALLDLEREIERYRPYLGLTPDEALARSRTARPAEKKLLEKLAGPGWGMLQLYFQLSPRELSALRAGQKLMFSAEPGPGEQPLPGDVARGVLQSLRDVRLIRYEDGFRISRGDVTAAGGLVVSSAPEARATATLALPQSELGQFALDGTAGVFTRSDLPRNSRIATSDGPLAFGRSALAPGQQNGAVNARMAHDPALAVQVAVQPVPSCHPAPDPTAAVASRPEPKATSADVWEALHRATHLPIVADYYTRLYAPTEVTVQSRRLFEALNQLCDAMRVRWNKEGDWLQFRSATFYDDRLKEVPNRLLMRWAATRQKQGSLPIDALVEIAQLCDAQLDAVSMAEGARQCLGLVEWDLARSRALRPHLRYLAGFTPAQRQEVTSGAGLPFARMPLPQQQQFISLALGGEPLQSLEELAGATVRVEYTQPGEFEWRVPGPNWLRFVAPLERGKEGRRQIMLPVRATTREAALAAARRLEPSVRDAMLQEARRRSDAVPDAPQMEPDPSQISPTQLDLRVVYIPGLSNRHPIHVVEPGADYFNTTW